MIAPREQNQNLRFVSLGLSQQEQQILEQAATQIGGVTVHANTDMELWNQARVSQFDLYIIGQSQDTPNPSYLIWLLKGIANHDRIILIYTSRHQEETERLKRYDAMYVLDRPIDPHRLSRMLESAIDRADHPPRIGLFSRLSNLFGRKRFTEVH